LQELEGEDQAEFGTVQELANHEKAFLEVPDDSNLEECSQSDQDSDQVDTEAMAQVERENRQHPLPVLQADLLG